MMSIVRNLSLSIVLYVFGFGVVSNTDIVYGQEKQDEVLSSLDSLFSSWDSHETPGCAVGVSQKGRPLVNRAYGMADLEHLIPNTSSVIFEAGSVSKQFTAAAVILLALDGHLSLDDDVRQFVPELPDYGETITLRHLINHTSGLRDWGSVASISGWGRSQRTHNHSHVLDILSRQSRLNFPPGERYSYSNSGYNLLAVVVERVSDDSFADYSNRRIFAPLRMTDTQWREDYRNIVQGRSSAYSDSEGAGQFRINRPVEHVHGNGGLLTTTGDLLKWNHALYSGYFGEEFTQEMLQQGVLNNGRVIDYAAGLRIEKGQPHTQFFHTGATSGYRAYLSWFPEQQLSVALLCNVTGVNPGNLGGAVSELFLDDRIVDDKSAKVDIFYDDENLREKKGIWVDEYNHQPVEITLNNEGVLKVKGGSVLIPLSDTEFRIDDRGQEEYHFFKSDEWSRPVIQVAREGYPEKVLLPAEPYLDGEVQSESYTGIFESADAETVLRIGHNSEDKLVIHRRPDGAFDLEPLYKDAFQARGFGLIRFLRDDNGDVSGLLYSSGRVYDMRFHRR